MPETVPYEFTYTMELTPLEADIRLEDFHPLSPWRKHFELFGVGPVVFWAREQDGKQIRTPTYDFITKGARERSRKNKNAVL